MSGKKIESVSDTARWVAYYRALESERDDALFRDPFAKLLAGKKGLEITRYIDRYGRHSWALAVRTSILDEQILRIVREHAVDTVLNLACGLDTRPYRLDLPASLKWIEVDLPGILTYKQEALVDQKPRCLLEQVNLDLSNRDERRSFFSNVNQKSQKVLVITEGLLIYLDRQQNEGLAEDLGAQVSFQWWLTDLFSPLFFSPFTESLRSKLADGNAKFRFGPAEGTEFFKPFRWLEVEFRSLLEESVRLNREPPMARAWRMISPIVPKNQQEKLKKISGIVMLRKGTEIPKNSADM